MYGLEHHTAEINGHVTMETENKQTREYSATQSMDTVRLSLAMLRKNTENQYTIHALGQSTHSDNT